MSFRATGMRQIFGKLRVLHQNGKSQTAAESELLDGGFRLQQDRNPVANGVHAPALVAFQSVFAAHYQGFSAYRTGEYFQQVRADHGCDSSKKTPRSAVSCARSMFRSS